MVRGFQTAARLELGRNEGREPRRGSGIAEHDIGFSLLIPVATPIAG
jgi:hypothetical protein